jgi:hypothetical protein
LEKTRLIKLHGKNASESYNFMQRNNAWLKINMTDNLLTHSYSFAVFSQIQKFVAIVAPYTHLALHRNGFRRQLIKRRILNTSRVEQLSK